MFIYRSYLKLFLGLVLLLSFLNREIHAQEQLELSTGAATSIVVQNEDVEPGDIIILSEDGNYFLSSKAYDSRMVGVIVRDPAVAFNDLNLENSVFLISQGETFVNVSTVNGNIKKGDFITSSSVPGIGQKADVSGQVLGIALQSYESESPDQVNDILVQLDIKPNVVSDVKVNLIEAWRKGSEAPFLTPLTSLRYILAALVTAGAFVVGFSSFSKASGKGVEALGRNPLAESTIKKGMVFNMILTFFIMLIGLVLAYLILVL